MRAGVRERARKREGGSGGGGGREEREREEGRLEGTMRVEEGTVERPVNVWKKERMREGVWMGRIERRETSSYQRA